MPLFKKKKKHGANMKELLRAYKDTGKIGNTKPKHMHHAIRIANAASYNAESDDQ